jgi:hypothetical protein
MHFLKNIIIISCAIGLAMLMGCNAPKPDGANGDTNNRPDDLGNKAQIEANEAQRHASEAQNANNRTQGLIYRGSIEGELHHAQKYFPSPSRKFLTKCTKV